MPKTLNTPCLRAFVHGLSSSEQDSLGRVMARIEAMGSQDEIDRLEKRLGQVRDELDRINTERDVLRLQKEDLQRTVDALDRSIARTPAADVIQMKLVLLDFEAGIEEQIAKMRPVELHTEKATLRKEIARRRLLTKLAEAMLDSARERTSG